MSYLSTLKPRHVHDCEVCRFLYQEDENDIYWCKSGLSGGSIISRFGDDGPEYSSMPTAAVLSLQSDSLNTISMRKALAHLSRQSIISISVDDTRLAEWDKMRRDS